MDAAAQFLSLLRSSIQETEPTLPVTPDWDSILRLAAAHHVLPVIYRAMSSLESFSQIPADVRSRLKGSVKAGVSKQINKNEDFFSLYERIRASGTDALCVKGAILRPLYPDGDMRLSSDADLFIKDDDFDACEKAILEYGLVFDQTGKSAEKTVAAYKSLSSGLSLELHRKLFFDYPAVCGKMNSWFDASDAYETLSDGHMLLTLKPTDNLLYLIGHSFKHFIYCGFGIRQVCDILLFARSYREDIDREYIKMKLSEISANRFFDAIVDIGTRHLGFDDKELFRTSADFVDGEALLSDILSAGTFGLSSAARQKSSNITLARANKDASSGVLSSLFPPLSVMKCRCAYLTKAPFLLPAAWCQRICSQVVLKISGKGEKYKASESIEIGAARVALMKQYGIVK